VPAAVLERNEVRTGAAWVHWGTMKDFTTILLMQTLEGIVQHVHEAPSIGPARKKTAEFVRAMFAVVERLPQRVWGAAGGV
jgi:hypothetical protein